MTDNLIGDIFYFGHPHGGFETYPNPESNPNMFAGYDNNTQNGWMLVAQKWGDNTKYTYVLYGLITAMTMGREGGCLGISIEFVGSYFDNLKLLLDDIELLFKTFIEKDEKLVSKTDSGKIAFKVEKLSDVGDYLEKKSQLLKSKITTKYLRHIRAADDIPEADDDAHNLNPDSSLKLINEIFETNGVIILSPNGRLEKRSAAERAADDNKSLKAKIAELQRQSQEKNNEIEEKNREIAELKQIVSQIQELVNSVTTRLTVPLGEDWNRSWEAQSTAISQKNKNFPNHKLQTVHSRETLPVKEPDVVFFKRPSVVLSAAVIILFLIIVIAYNYCGQANINSLPNRNLRTNGNSNNSQLSNNTTNSQRSGSQINATQLNPAPNDSLSNTDLRKLNDELNSNLTAGAVANLAIRNNNSDIKAAYGNQIDAYTNKLIEKNPGCFEGNDKNAKLICPTLSHVPIYKQPKNK